MASRALEIDTLMGAGSHPLAAVMAMSDDGRALSARVRPWTKIHTGGDTPITADRTLLERYS